MIVISTHNGQDNLDRLLNSVEEHGTDGQDVCVVVSGDSTEEYKNYVLSRAREWGRFKLEVLIEPVGVFETGAFIYAYRQLPKAKAFLFLQDSMEVTGRGWVKQFTDKMVPGTCLVPWVTFAPYLLGTTPQVQKIIVDTHGLYREPGFGIFGNMFYTSRITLDMIDRAGYLEFIPTNKAEAEATERFWALYCSRLDIEMRPIHTNAFQHIRDGGELPLLRKHFHLRVGSARG